VEKWRAKEFLLKLTGVIIKENLRIAKRTEKVFLLKQMGINIKDNLRMTI